MNLKQLIEEYEIDRFTEIVYIILHSLAAEVTTVALPTKSLFLDKIKSFGKCFGLFCKSSKNSEYF
jgi:hypothetical protein